MAGNVAVKGDVSAEASASALNTGQPNAVGGSWTAGAISETSYQKLSIGGTKVIHEAQCTFTYQGNDSSSGSPLPPKTSTVTLTATTKKLMSDSDYVLVDGDSEQDDDGNKLSVSTGAVLSTA